MKDKATGCLSSGEEGQSHEGTRDNENRLLLMSTEENMIRRLYKAAEIGSLQNLKTLIQEDEGILEKGCSFACFSTKSPLHISVLHGHLEFTRFLLNQKPDLAVEVDTLQHTPLHLASANGDIEIVRALLEKNTSACLIRDSSGLIPLHHSVIKGRIQIMQELINARPRSIWTKLNNGQTVLHLCIKENHLEAIRLLIELVINDQEFLNTIDDSGNTILDLSLMLRRIEVIRYLLSIPGMKTGITSSGAEIMKACPRSSYNIEIQEIENVPIRGSQQSELLSPISAAKKTSWWKDWKKRLKYKGDWLQEVQGTLMLVATVIATVTFQGAINPPGGVWQQDMPYNSTAIMVDRKKYRGQNETVFPAGTAIMAYQRGYYSFYLIANTISFLSSICVVQLIISRLALKNRIFAWLLTVTMSVAVASLAFSYIVGIEIVNGAFDCHEYSEVPRLTYFIAEIIWWVMVGVVGLCYAILCIIWVVKVQVWIFKRLLRTFSNI